MASTDISLFAYEAAELKKGKSPTALRTISEASEALDVPQHVLRFWETKFSQIKPLKRNGGRRFYRPQDIDVLQQIKHLLYNQGYTIKGAKKAVDDFLNARHERAVSSEEWLATLPPASVNDNIAGAFVSKTSPTEAEFEEASNTADLLAELAQEINQAATIEAAAPANKISATAREELYVLRNDLVRMREALRSLLPVKIQAPVYQ